jgi:hypothetical protein
MADVIVVGGGTSGFVAALAAARAGAKVLILEQSSYLGGTMTGGLVPGLVSLRHQPWKNQETLVESETLYAGEQMVRGIAQEFVDRMIKADGAFGHAGESSVRVLFDPEVAKWVIDSMVKEAGVKVHYYSKVISVTKKGNAVIGVVVNHNESIPGKVVVDATGDGNVCYMAGARYELGEAGKPNFVQPLSFYFLLGGVQIDKTIQYIGSRPEDFSAEYIQKLKELRRENKPFAMIGLSTLGEQAAKNGDYPIPYGVSEVHPRTHLCLFRPLLRGGKVRYDMTMHNVDMAYKVDPTNIAQLSDATIAMREFTFGMARFFRKYVPGFEESYLLQIADMVGIRESRRIIGDYVLTKDDVFGAKSFDDSIGRFGAGADFHNLEGSEKSVYLKPIKGGRSYQIPYRILLPAGLENLLVAGRCVSTDRTACASIREQAGCIVTGQAAGAAAGLAAMKGISPRAIAVGELQELLRTQGVIL